MAYLPLNYMYPNFLGAHVEPTSIYSIERDPIVLLIEEVIDFSLRYHNLNDWIPPVNLDVARSLNNVTYFNENFASTVNSPDTEAQAMRLANSLGFNEEIWLEFINYEEARRYQKYYLLNIYHNCEPFLFQMFSFACYASRTALLRQRHDLVNVIVWALLEALREILPNEEYYRESYFGANVYNYQHIDPTSHVDEGIVDEANSLIGNERSLSLVHVNPIILFVEELIDFSLRYDNLNHWIPVIDIETLRRTEMRYFTENLGRAITHFYLENSAVYAAREWGFNEAEWLGQYRASEARNFQNYFLWKLLHFHGEFLMFSFACYSSKIAMRIDRHGLVNEVVSALIHLLRHYYPHQEHYREFDYWASEYNNDRLYSDSVDDGIHSIENETVGSEENIEVVFEEEASPPSDVEQNEIEESDTRSSIVKNEEAEERGSISSIVENEEADDRWDSSKKANGMYTLEEKNGICALEEGSGSDTSGESGSDTSEESDSRSSIVKNEEAEERGSLSSIVENEETDDRWDASKKATGMHMLEETNGICSSEASELDTSGGSGSDTSEESDSRSSIVKNQEAKERGSLSSIVENEETVDRWDASKKANGMQTLEETNGICALEEASGSDTSEANGSNTSGESGSDTSGESGSDTSGESGSDTSGEWWIR